MSTDKYQSNTIFNEISAVLNDLKNGKPIIVVDDENRENEGDLLMLADTATYASVLLMINEARGLICTPMSEEWAYNLGLNLMVAKNSELHGTAFTVSVDVAANSTTGISAQDRLNTILALADKKSKPIDFRRPGHIFPLIAKNGGVIEREGHTEAAVDLAKMAGASPVGVICEILSTDGSMARGDELFTFAKKHNLKITSVDKIIQYRKKEETLISLEAKCDLPTHYGQFSLQVFSEKISASKGGNKEIIALIKGKPYESEAPLVRIHSSCITGDIFSSQKCDCGDQLHNAMETINANGCGMIIYLSQEGRGIGLINKIKSYNLQEQGMDTLEANLHLGFEGDLRDYAFAAQVLKINNINSISLISNNPNKIESLERYGIEIKNRVPTIISRNEHNNKYLQTKAEKMGHIIPINKDT